MNTENKFASCIGWVVAWLSSAVVAVWVDGWALSTIWNWFIPTIFGLVPLTIMQAVGVSLVFSLFTRTNRIETKESTSKNAFVVWLEATMKSVFTPVFSVIIAWIIFQFAF